MNIKKPKRWVLTLVCYAAAVVIWLAVSGISIGLDNFRARSGELEPAELLISDMQTGGVELRESDDGWQFFLTRGDDPRIIYAPGEKFRATRLSFKATPHMPAGEIILYYTRSTGEISPDEGFSERNKLWARQDGDGTWYFDLGGANYTGLRLDPGTTSGVIWKVERLALNDPKPVLSYFVPDARIIFLLLTAPGFVAMALREAAGILRMFYLRRRA